MFSDVFPCFHNLPADLFSRLRLNAGFFRPEFLNRLDEIIAPGRRKQGPTVMRGDYRVKQCHQQAMIYSIIYGIIYGIIYRISILPHGIIYG